MAWSESSRSDTVRGRTPRPTQGDWFETFVHVCMGSDGSPEEVQDERPRGARRPARRSGGAGQAAAVVAAAVLLMRADALTHPADKAMVLTLYNLTRGDEWREGFRWTRGVLTGLDPCDDEEFFKGLSCTGEYGDPDRRASKILLSAMMLNGTLPDDIGNFTMLEELLLTDNNLGGSLPSSLCQLKHLNTLDLAFNRISGTIPSCIKEVKRLYKFDLRTNMLVGTIPKEFGSLQELQQLYLSENHLTGTIPPELYDAKMLSVLFLSYNQLTGTIPRLFARFRMKETPSMQGLSWLDMRSNQLEGTFPSVIGDFGAV